MTLSLPDGAVKYAQTKIFTETTIPKTLLSDHSTKPNSWGLIVVNDGALIYTRTGQNRQVLTPGTNGVIFPAELHKIAPDGKVSFHVEFHHDPDTQDAARDTEGVNL